MKSFVYIIFLTFLSIACSKEKRSDLAAEKMQEFVISISSYAKNIKSGFIIIPQNGIELAYNNTDPGDALNTAYLNAIDGIGVEALFYEGELIAEDERLGMLQQLKTTKKIMVAEYLNDKNYVSDALTRNYNEGFICFPRVSSNYDYKEIPDSTPHSDTSNIFSLSDAQNYLYLINTENFQSKEEMINAIAATDFDIVLIDLFFNESALTAAEISILKKKPNGARRLVIAYMNIGSAEKFRYYWKKTWGVHHPLMLKRKYEGYDDEIWVKFWKSEWQDIIYGNDDSYTKKIIDAGFDGAYLDNVEAYYFLYYKD
jgi:cysteinyl-tRNA synthetase